MSRRAVGLPAGVYVYDVLRNGHGQEVPPVLATDEVRVVTPEGHIYAVRFQEDGSLSISNQGQRAEGSFAITPVSGNVVHVAVGPFRWTD